jgi:hypothetical protein
MIFNCRLINIQVLISPHTPGPKAVRSVEIKEEGDLHLTCVNLGFICNKHSLAKSIKRTFTKGACYMKVQVLTTWQLCNARTGCKYSVQAIWLDTGVDTGSLDSQDH